MKQAIPRSAAHLRLVESFPPEPAIFVATEIEPARRLFRDTKWQKVSGWFRARLMRLRVWRKCREPIPF